jgi:predicted amidohydrolase YtcJ
LPGGPKTAVDRDGATLVDLLVDNEKIAAIEPAGVAASADLPAIDLEAHYVWPTLIDMHAHLEKGHIVTRTENRQSKAVAPVITLREIAVAVENLDAGPNTWWTIWKTWRRLARGAAHGGNAAVVRLACRGADRDCGARRGRLR